MTEKKEEQTSKSIKYCLGCQAQLSIHDNPCPWCSTPQLTAFEVRWQQFGKRLLPKTLPATKFLCFINIVFFIILTLDITMHPDFGISDALISPPGELVYRWGAHIRGEMHWWRMFTANFIHFGIIHLLFNITALRYVTPYVERTFGSLNTFNMYILLGAVSMTVSNLIGGNGIVAGASGAIMAFVGMSGMAAHLEHTPLSKKLRNNMIFVGIATIAFGLFVNSSIGNGIDNIAHIAGLISGMIIGAFLPKLGPTGYNRPWKIRLATLLFLISLTLTSISFSFLSDTSVSNKHLSECRQELRIKHFEQALGHCKEAYQANDSDLATNHFYIISLLMNRKYDEALAICQDAETKFAEERQKNGSLPFDAVCRELQNPQESLGMRAPKKARIERQ